MDIIETYKELEDLKKALEKMRTSSNDYIREMEEVYTNKEFFSFCQTIFGDIEKNE